jgi:D-3-phosphoglycerate dehydrogenase
MPLIKTVIATDPILPSAAHIIAASGHRLVVSPENGVTLKHLIAQADALIVRSKLPDDALDDAASLRGIVRHGVGLDFIPMQRASELAIPVANVPGGNTQSVAEYVFAAIFDVARPLRAADVKLRDDSWGAARAVAGHAMELKGKRLGIVGLGNIGRRVAEIGALAFGMQVVGAQRRLAPLPEFVRPVTLDEVFTQSDFVVLSCPLTPETKGMVGATLLGRMMPTAYLINAARGQLIEDMALVCALRESRIAGAALDVFSIQPLPQDHPFRTLPNLLLTPHLAGLTADSMERIGRAACEDLVRMLRGERPFNFANPEIWPAAQARWNRLDAAEASSG